MGFSLLASTHAWCGPVLVFTMQVTRQTLNGHNQSKNHYTQIHQDKYKGAGRIQCKGRPVVRNRKQSSRGLDKTHKPGRQKSKYTESKNRSPEQQAKLLLRKQAK